MTNNKRKRGFASPYTVISFLMYFEDQKGYRNFLIRKSIFTCLFSINNTISLSRHEQVCLSGLRFERYFSHH